MPTDARSPFGHRRGTTIDDVWTLSDDLNGHTGPTGPTGPTGATGPTGPTGATGT